MSVCSASLLGQSSHVTTLLAVSGVYSSSSHIHCSQDPQTLLNISENHSVDVCYICQYLPYWNLKWRHCNHLFVKWKIFNPLHPNNILWKIARFFKTETHLVREVIYHFTFLQRSLMAGLEKGCWILISASEFTLQSVLLIDVPRETVASHSCCVLGKGRVF